MRGGYVVKAGQCDTQQPVGMGIWQALRFGLIQVDDDSDGHGTGGPRLEHADAARLNQTFDRFGNIGDDPGTLALQACSVIGHQSGTHRHQLQRQ